eukprot:2753950-Alexandrium_andersonii.AAC.1
MRNHRYGASKGRENETRTATMLNIERCLAPPCSAPHRRSGQTQRKYGSANAARARGEPL